MKLRNTVILLTAISLTSCTQGINQHVNVDLGKLGDILASSKPQASPSSKPSSGTPNTSSSASPIASPTPIVSASPVSLTPVEKTPEPTVSASATATFDATIFQTSIPLPFEVKAFLRTEIKQAVENWKIRYEKSKSSPYQVTKMGIDIMMLATSNPELAAELMKAITIELPASSGMGTLEQAASELKLFAPGLEGKASLIYHFPYSTLKRQFDLSNFENRQLVIANVTPTGYVVVSNPDELAPENPKEEDQLTFHIEVSQFIEALKDIKSYTQKSLVYTNGGWMLMPKTLGYN